MEKEELLEQNQCLWDVFQDLQQDLLKKKWTWLQFLVSTMAAVFGILVSFGRPESNDSFCVRLFFVCGVVLFALSIISLVICLYGFIDLNKRRMNKITEEAQNALLYKRRINVINKKARPVFRLFEIIGYSCFGLGLISLCVYIGVSLL